MGDWGPRTPGKAAEAGRREAAVDQTAGSIEVAPGRRFWGTHDKGPRDAVAGSRLGGFPPRGREQLSDLKVSRKLHGKFACAAGLGSEVEPLAKVTIADVATLAGVSTATVSRVLNNKGRVDGEIRRRVLSAVDQLDYKPRRRSPAASSRAGSIVVQIGLQGDPGADWYFGRIIRGVESVLREANRSLVLSTNDSVTAILPASSTWRVKAGSTG